MLPGPGHFIPAPNHTHTVRLSQDNPLEEWFMKNKREKDVHKAASSLRPPSISIDQLRVGIDQCDLAS